MIAYMLQIHHRFEQAARLIEWLYHPDNLYMLVVDSAKEVPNGFSEKISALDNVVLFNDLPATWGGVSLVAATLEVMRRALDLSQNWRSFINLSGVDVPLKPQHEMLRILDEHRAKGQTSFVIDFGAREFQPHGKLDKSVHQSELIPFRSDLTIEVFGSARELFGQGGSPVTRPEQRMQIHVDEDLAAKRLRIRPLYQTEIDARRTFFAQHNFHFGRQWFILDRRACEFAISSPLSLSLFEYLKTVLIPDECFFQTLFRASKDSVNGVVFDKNFRFRFGGPLTLQDGLLPEMQDSGAFFARKLNLGAPNCERIEELAEANSYRG